MGRDELVSRFAGYHYYQAVDGGSLIYADIATCPQPEDSPVTTEETVKEAFSHELIEAITDPTPAPYGLPGYAFDDLTNPWSYSWGEVADVCFLSPAYEGADGLSATRVWSNSAALLSTGSPCIPTPAGEIYMNVSVDPAGTAIVHPDSSHDQTVTFTLNGWSTGAVADWAVNADSNGFQTFSPRVMLNGDGSPIAMNNGTSATLTVNIPRGTPSDSFAGVMVYSYVPDTETQPGYFLSFAMAAVYVE